MSQPQDRGASTGAPPTHAALPVTTAFDFPEWKTDRYVGSCFGLIVRSMGALKGLGAAFKTIKGGEVTQYTELLEDSRRHAMDRMIENARIMGANAVVGMRFDSSVGTQPGAATGLSPWRRNPAQPTTAITAMARTMTRPITSAG